MTPLLNVEGLELGYSGVEVVFGVDLVVYPGELVGLIGGNGSGKSSLLRAISGMIKPVRGKVGFAGCDITDQAAHDIVSAGLAHVPMGRQLFLDMSVEENLALGAYLPRARKGRKTSAERVYTLFPDLLAKRKLSASKLSGGQQQMLAVTRALMSNPKMILMDEPSSGLAPRLAAEVLRAVRSVAKSGLSVLLVEQNVMQVLGVSDRAYILEQGRVVKTGPSSELQGDAAVRKAYLGL